MNRFWFRGKPQPMTLKLVVSTQLPRLNVWVLHGIEKHSLWKFAVWNEFCLFLFFFFRFSSRRSPNPTPQRSESKSFWTEARLMNHELMIKLLHKIHSQAKRKDSISFELSLVFEKKNFLWAFYVHVKGEKKSFTWRHPRNPHKSKTNKAFIQL